MSVRLAAILLLVLSNAFFVAAEFALVRAKRSRLEAMARDGDRWATSALRLLNSDRALPAAQLGITLSSLGLGWLLADTVRLLPFPAATPGRESIGIMIWAIAIVAAVTFVHILFGELVPKVAALSQPERLARALAPPLGLFAAAVSPFTWTLHRAAGLATRRYRSRQEQSIEEESVHSPDELRHLVERSQESGALAREDADLLEGVFEFAEKCARDVMTPRIDIVTLPLAATLDETLRVIEEQAFSRYPVADGSVDNIVGLVLAKDLLRFVSRPAESFSLGALMRPVHVIPGTRQIEEVLGDFKRLKEHMAIVLDEYGGTAGLVTMEDLLEEIVGEILDEHDDPLKQLGRARSGEVMVPGETNVDELNERFGLAVPSADYTTIGGFIFGTLGRIPRVGDQVSAGGAVFHVRTVANRRAEMLAMSRAPTGAEDEPPQPTRR